MISRRTRTVLATLGFLAIAVFFLTTEHRAHHSGILPYLLLLACPFFHLFMHAGHGARSERGRAQRHSAAHDGHSVTSASSATGATREDRR